MHDFYANENTGMTMKRWNFGWIAIAKTKIQREQVKGFNVSITLFSKFDIDFGFQTYT